MTAKANIMVQKRLHPQAFLHKIRMNGKGKWAWSMKAMVTENTVKTAKMIRILKSTFFALILVCIVSAIVLFYTNPRWYILFFGIAAVLFPVLYVKLWELPILEVIKALCIVLTIEGFCVFGITWVAVIPLSIVYLVNAKKGNGKCGVMIACLVIGILFFTASFFKLDL
ncbi:MAG: hypothetical protein RSC25_08145 [Christensenella sp.]